MLPNEMPAMLGYFDQFRTIKVQSAMSCFDYLEHHPGAIIYLVHPLPFNTRVYF